MSKVFYDKPIINQIFEEFRKEKDDCDIEKLAILVAILPEEDVNVQDYYGWTVLIYASRYGYTEIVKLLLEKEGIDVNVQDNEGWTALNYVPIDSYTGIVKLLKDYKKKLIYN